MKLITTTFFSCICLVTLAQQNITQQTTTVDDDGKRLKLIIFANTDKGIINYKNEFDIQGLNQEQKDKIVDRVMDSLQLNKSKTTNEKITTSSPSNVDNSNSTTNKDLYAIAEKFNDEQVSHFNKGDMIGVASFYTDDAIIYHPGKIYQGRDSINKYWTDIKGAKNWKLTIKEVGGNKNSFWVAGVSELTVVAGNADKTFVSNYIVIMQPDKNGKYKIYKDIYNQGARN